MMGHIGGARAGHITSAPSDLAVSAADMPDIPAPTV